MDADHLRLRERVLAYEELDPGEQRELDAHLGSCSHCRELLAALRARESAVRLEGQLSPEPLPLSAEDALAERASLERLVGRLVPPAMPAMPPGERRPVVLAGRVRRWKPAWAWLVPAAAAAVVAIVYTTGVRQTPPALPRLEGLDVVRASQVRGVADSVFHTGDAFALHVRLTSPGIPIVVVVDEAGAPTLLHPASGEVTRVHAPGTLTLPDANAGEVWTFSGAPGRETFLAAALPAGPAAAADLSRLQVALAVVATSTPDRELRIRAARAALVRFAGDISELTVRHSR